MKDRTLLMIPGPIEFDPSVLAALGAPTTSHLAPQFLEAFGQSLDRMRQVFQSHDGQPFILAGSGTLAMDSVGANLVEPGDKALVVSTGFFSERYGAILERYGAQVTYLRAAIGGRPSLEEVEKSLADSKYKLLVATHVDTSTGVITDVQSLSALAQRFGALTIVDGVCSIAGEDLQMSEWGIDVALTASQKAVGVPPGLALFVVAPRAMMAFKSRKSLVSNYYGDWGNWLPVMQSIEARQPSYFCTPPVNLIWALNTSLGQILEEGLQKRFARHKLISQAIKAAIQTLELEQVPLEAGYAANTLTAPRYPTGVNSASFLPAAAKAGVTMAGGLLQAIKNEYFRIGHMGAVTQADALAVIGAIEYALKASGYAVNNGAGLAAAQSVFASA